jgi:predicted RNA-binding Zn ribbon-like protein
VSTKQPPRDFQFDLSGGHLALDFANTVSRRDDPEKRREHISTYRDLISFVQQSRLITQLETEVLRNEAESNPSQAGKFLRTALILREALFRSFSHAAAGKAASPEDIQVIEKFAANALRHRHLTRAHDSYVWKWEDGTDLERILWPIAHSAAELMVSENLAKVRECEAGDCQWLFLDTSRNHSRRWCDMTSCGNREKARRHYQRHRT